MSDHDPTYAAKLVALLRRSPVATPAFIDGGACHGDFAALLRTEFARATIHAFEPNPALAADLTQRFRGDAAFHLWQLALHGKTGSIEFHVHADPGTSSLLRRPTGDRRYYHSGDRVVASVIVPTISLDEFIAAHAPGGVGLLKLDTQGAELAILRGARGALASGAIEVVYCEFFIVPHYAGAPLLGDLMGFLGQFGYSMFDLFKGPYARNGQLRFGDAIFISPAFRSRHVDTLPEEP